MKFAIIKDGTVINIAVADEPLESNWIESDVAQIGDKYENGHFVPQAPDYELAAQAVRADRNIKLSASDWTQVADAPVDKAAWTAYRQALRDMPQQEGFPTTIVWPEKP
jgi:hypothetical protein